jgi:hypothetical protein
MPAHIVARGLQSGHRPAALIYRPHGLAVKLQPVDDLVDHLALGAHREADE